MLNNAWPTHAKNKLDSAMKSSTHVTGNARNENYISTAMLSAEMPLHVGRGNHLLIIH